MRRRRQTLGLGTLVILLFTLPCLATVLDPSFWKGIGIVVAVLAVIATVSIAYLRIEHALAMREGRAKRTADLEQYLSTRDAAQMAARQQEEQRREQEEKRLLVLASAQHR